MAAGGRGESIIPIAIFKATYTKSTRGAKASIRYIQHRPGKDNKRVSRVLFGWDGAMERSEAYHMIENAKKGSLFFRFIISPDPTKEDTERDLYLREITELTMRRLEDRVGKEIQWVGTVHDDHTQYRHVHVLAIVPG